MASFSAFPARFFPSVFLAGLLAAMWPAPDAVAQAPRVENIDGSHAGEFFVPIGKSQILELDVPFTELLVGQSDIADVLALSDRTVYALGKALGSTSLTIRGETGRLVAVVDLVVGPDIGALKNRLFELMPDEDIQVRPVNEGIVISGSVASAAQQARALAVAEQFAPGGVTNLLGVRDNQQVMLKVRFAEVSRAFLRNFDSGLQVVPAGGSANGDFSLLPRFTTVATQILAQGLLGFSVDGIGNLRLTLNALEEKRIMKTLAEPNLTATSGGQANFLAGGEFPIPVAQDKDGTVTVAFKQFGVGLAFTPTVIGDGLIHIEVAPEVSRIDNTITFSAGSITVPGIRVRRARTSVELRDGQAFAIAGLLQDDFDDTARQLPGFGDLPIIGALMRSTSFRKQQTELVIIVEPHIVTPVPAGTLATPADNFVPPKMADLIFLGQIEGRSSGRPGAGAARSSGDLLGRRTAGGINGAYGHIIK